MTKKNKILYLHTGLRNYRLELFNLLAKELEMDFFWTQNLDFQEKHVAEEAKRMLKDVNFVYYQANEFKEFLFTSFSWDLFKLPFLKYKVYILTSSVSIPFLILAPILKLFNKKIIVFDELWRYPKERLKYKIIYPYVKLLIKVCVSSVVVSGTKAKEFYINDYKFNKDKIFIAYNTTFNLEKLFDSNLNYRINNLLNKTTQKKKILYLARCIELKGLDILIRAMSEISEEYDLIVVGEGDFLDTCRNYAVSLNLNNRIHFIGSCYSNESLYFYKNCDLFILPTKEKLNNNAQVESWGFVVNEAIISGIPVISTTAVGSSYDLLDENCISIQSDVHDLVKKINYVILNNENNKIGKKQKYNMQKKCDYQLNLEAYKKAILCTI
ncbi:MAG: glycosyltransferase [Aliarcobacter sp.]|nr:glycosyltransferase [Aliarcobacter sp.]